MLERSIPWAPDYEAVYQLRRRLIRTMYLSNGKVDEKRINVMRLYYRDDPIDFIETWCDTIDTRNAGTELFTRMPFILFPRQKEAVMFIVALILSETNGLFEKSRDMGVTWICICVSVWLFFFWDGAAVGWGSRTALQVDRLGDPNSIFEKIRTLILGIPEPLWPPGFSADQLNYMKITNSATNSSIVGEAGDNVGRGGRSLVYFKDESAHYEHPESIEAALGDNTRVQIDISSVNGLGNVFHRKRESGIDWEVGKEPVKGRTNVFVMDWRDHPLKTPEWYRERRENAEREGLLHIFYQEVDRNYAASLEGVIIHPDWVKAAIDAHIKLGLTGDGGWTAALDVADGDGTGDRNALAKRKGVVLKYLNEWGERDTGVTARKAVGACENTLPIELMYDCIGVGSGVKAETNRLKDEDLMPAGMRLIPWDAGSRPLNPDDYVGVMEDGSPDKDTPLNKDYYKNLKAHGWWDLRRRFERTWRAVTQGFVYNEDQLISIPSGLPKLRQLEKELCQPTIGKSTRMQLIVNKAPNGTRSPNLADAVMMCYFPVPPNESYDTTFSWVGELSGIV